MIQNLRRTRGQRGFTMIEVIAVLLIIGIVAVVAVSRMVNTTSAYDLASQLEVVKAHLRLAQAQALGSNSSWGITFASSTTYYLFNGSAPTTAVKLLGENDATISLTTKKSGLTITSAPQTITFNGYGSPVDGSGNVLTSNTTVTTNGGSITITKNTGFIP